MSAPVQVTFRAKAKPQHYVGEAAPRYHYVQVPTLNRSHVDMEAARRHRRYGSYANSNLFLAILAHAARQVIGGARVRLDAPPDGVEVDASGFLIVVRFNLPE